MATIRVTKIYPDGSREELPSVEKEPKAPRRKTRASKNNKKEQEQQSVGKTEKEDSGS